MKCDIGQPAGPEPKALSKAKVADAKRDLALATALPLLDRGFATVEERHAMVQALFSWAMAERAAGRLPR